jgi:hypothetical protein
LETWIVKGDAGFETESLFKKHIGDTFLEPASPVVRETQLVYPRLLCRRRWSSGAGNALIADTACQPASPICDRRHGFITRLL